jgi:Flp pilus assembly protein TadG
MLRQLLSALWQTDRGTALIESALVLPVLLMLVGGVYEFGYYFYQQQLMTSGVRDAARYLALTANPNNAFNQNDAMRLAVYGVINGDTTARVSGWSTADVTISVTALDNSLGTYCSGCMIEVITVATSFTDSSLGFLNLLGLKNPIISVSHQERWVGGSAPEIHR